MNAYFSGRYYEEVAKGQRQRKPMKWMRRLGILWHSHSIVLEAREGPNAEYDGGYMKSMLVNSYPVSLLRAGEKAEHKFTDGTSMLITWLLAGEPDGDELVDKYEVRVGDVLT